MDNPKHLSLATITIALACAALFPATAFAQHAGHADHAAHAAHEAPAPAPGQRHASDAPLRKGMADIRTAVAALDHHEHGHMNEQQALATVAIVERSIGYIVANCKLEPEADHALHGVLAKLGKGVAAMKADPNDMTALAPMREAVADYSKLFDDDAH